jgi:hypothetical protein
VSWASKKQNSVALSTAEAEYIESAIHMADNPVEHSRTKHIAIRYHFLRDHQQRGDIEMRKTSR